MLEYHAAYFKQPSGWYVVELLDFPGVLSQGKTLKSARGMIRDALKLMAECYAEKGKPLPRPNPKATAKKADYLEPVRLSFRVQKAASG
jgi:predicted RNase H-like HicB family nuclease